MLFCKIRNMQVFYAPNITNNSFYLDEKESKHCIRALRMVRGDHVRMIDGKGNLYEGVISNPDPKKCRISITNINHSFEKRDYRINIAISPIKNHERFEWFIEKSVEIGVDEITPLICHNTEKTNLKTDRINNLIISAMKQSLKAVKTELQAKCFFSEFIRQNIQGVKIIAHCNESILRKSFAEAYEKSKDVVIMIGPEGDFTPEEINQAMDNGFISAHLGPSRLRTETAGVAACHSVYFINQ
jgi:16S rRNA (uracil1498-N3)-methyltransferase